MILKFKHALIYSAFAATSLIGVSSHAINLPEGFSQNIIANGLEKPFKMQFATDGRIFLTERVGRVRVIKDGKLLPTPFVSLNVEGRGERGLLGIETDPQFETQPYIYVFYTALSPVRHDRISRFRADKDTVNPDSEEVLLELDPTNAGIHHSGAMRFGEDGLLYITTGDNGNRDNAQNLSSLQGKVLRIRKDGTIPNSNPFYTTTSGKYRAIWALGLRNPFSFDIQRGTGLIYINDVGQNTWEEINRGVAGGNYGWPLNEGAVADSKFQSPVYAYDHNAGRCAITGAAFYSPVDSQFPDNYNNSYFFGDYCADKIWRRDPRGEIHEFASALNAPIELVVSPDGALYYIPLSSGNVYKISYTGELAPSISNQPADQKVGLDQIATFSCDASGATPLKFQWKKDGVNISGATSKTLKVGPVKLSQNGERYRCEVTNEHGSDLSLPATLTVLNNYAPVPKITLPLTTFRYLKGEKIEFQGTAQDQEDGALAASKLTWYIDFHHDNHVHPRMITELGVESGSYTVPTDGETSRNVFYRIHLEALDSAGLKGHTQLDIYPAALRVPTLLQAEDADDKNGGQGISGGWSFDANGSIMDRFKFSETRDYVFQIRARGTLYQGLGPIIKVKVGGTVVAQVQINNLAYETKTIRLPIKAGIHRISLVYDNDQQGAGENRKLDLDWFRVAPAP